MSQWVEQLDLLIRSRTPILWIHQQEEERLIRLLGNACQRLGQRTLLRWDFVGGLQGLPNHNGHGARQPLIALDSLGLLAGEQPAILLLLDFHRYADDPAICLSLIHI